MNLLYCGEWALGWARFSFAHEVMNSLFYTWLSRFGNQDTSAGYRGVAIVERNIWQTAKMAEAESKHRHLLRFRKDSYV